MIKALIFDCFGVLTVDPWQAFCATLPETADMEQARSLNRAFDKGIISKQEFFDGVELATGQRPPDIETVRGTDVVKNVQLLKYIESLKPQYKIALLSNISNDWITEELLTEQEQSLFDTMVFSHHVGLVKPDPRIFQLVCERLGVETSETIMIDDIAGNVETAQREGMKGVVYADYATATQELSALLNTNN